MPLWIRPDRKLSVHDVMELMRDYYGGTDLDMTKDVGAGPYGCPYRWRPMTWKVDSVEYLNERAISTQQTGFSFVAQARSWLPDHIGGVLWFGVDDTAATVWVPQYAGNRAVARGFAAGTARFDRFSWDSAFWVFNFVSNWAYGRWADMIQDVRSVQGQLEGEFLARQPEARPQVKAPADPAGKTAGAGGARPKQDRAAMFARRDKDGDGKLTREEFLTGQPDPDEGPKRFLLFDVNKDGFLSREEFISGGKAQK